MKKISLIALVALLCVALATPALAKNDNDKAATVRQDKADKESVTSTPGVYSPRALSIWGEVVAISSNTLPADLTVKVSKVAPTKLKDFTGAFPAKDSLVVLHLTADTKIVRKYSGRADFSELAVGDKVDGFGKLQSDGTVNALRVKDNSIHAVVNANKGEVTAIDLAAKTFTVKKGAKQYTVFVTDATVFKKAGLTSTTFADLKVGDEVNVRGVIRQATNEINADSVLIKMGQKEQAVKKLELNKQNLEKRVQAARDTLAKLLAQLEEVLKKLIDAAPVATTTPAATTTSTPSATTTP